MAEWRAIGEKSQPIQKASSLETENKTKLNSTIHQNKNVEKLISTETSSAAYIIGVASFVFYFSINECGGLNVKDA